MENKEIERKIQQILARCSGNEEYEDTIGYYDYFDGEEAITELVGLIEQEIENARGEGLREGLRRHTWMRDGVTYVGNGTYTLKEAEAMLEKDLLKLGN